MHKIFKISIIILEILLLTGCFETKKAQNYTKDIQAAMDAKYLGNYEQYIKLNDTSKENVKDFHDSMVKYLTSAIMQYNGIIEEKVNDETYEKYLAFSDKVLSSAKYTIDDVQYINGYYETTINIKPIDIWTPSFNETNEYIENFYNQHKDLPQNNQALGTIQINDENTTALHNEYTNEILKILNKYDIKYQNEISINIKLNKNKKGFNIISSNDWHYISDYIMGLR